MTEFGSHSKYVASFSMQKIKYCVTIFVMKNQTIGFSFLQIKHFRKNITLFQII